MGQIETISWRELTGNRFNRSINSAMLKDSGYVKRVAIRRVGQRERAMFDVVYDRAYFYEMLARLICRPLFILGKQKVLELVDEAWERYYPSSTLKAVETLKATNENYAKVQS